MKDRFQISLKAARVNANLKLLEAAKAIGIGKDTLIKWEKDSSNVNPKWQAKISAAYGISINNIFFGIKLD